MCVCVCAYLYACTYMSVYVHKTFYLSYIMIIYIYISIRWYIVFCDVDCRVPVLYVCVCHIFIISPTITTFQTGPAKVIISASANLILQSCGHCCMQPFHPFQLRSIPALTTPIQMLSLLCI
jgi:hypothetical protein